MGKFTGVLLASDFDNTLIYTQDALRTGAPIPPLSEGNRAALEHFMREGGRFAIATGRALPAFAQLKDMVPFNTPCVVCNGAAIYDFARETYLETALLPEQTQERIQPMLAALAQVGAEAYHVENVIHAVQINEFVRAHEHLTGVQLEERESLLDVPGPLGKLLFEGERTALSELERRIRSARWADEYELIYSGQTLLELTATGASKGGMLLRLADRCGIARENVYAVGDERNDISMLTAAAVGFAPENCAEEVRRCGARLVCDAREDALAQVVAALEARYA